MAAVLANRPSEQDSRRPVVVLWQEGLAVAW